MQRIINDPNMVVEDMLKGFAKCHRDIIHVDEENPRVVISNSFNKQKKVGIVTGGGSGHKPAFIGYCGEHMADAVAVGEIFSSPTAKSFYDSIRAVDQGMGVAVLYGNYAGDNMNVKMAMELAEDDDIEVRTVVANDDVASAPKEDIAKLRSFNRNASENSCHQYGTTFDIAYNKYYALTRPVRDDTLKWVLAEVLNTLRSQKRCYVKHERHQGCFHITVR